MLIRAKALKIKKSNAQKEIEQLKAEGKIAKGLRIKSMEDFIIVPVLDSHETAEEGLFEKSEKTKKMKENLKEQCNGTKMHSFDVIGNIAIVEIAEQDKNKEKEIGKAIAMQCNAKTVYAKDSGMQGEYRVRKLKLIYGKDDPIADYSESKAKMRFNVKDVFFSTRLSYERSRISALVKEKENVLVMFAGVGPFALVIAKNCKNCNVTGIELNEKAVEYFKNNIKLNKLSNANAVLGDVAKTIDENYEGKFDRVVMPLPKDAEFFLEHAEKAVKNNGIIHFYAFVNRKNAFEEAEKKARKHLTNEFEVVFSRIVRDYSKDIVQVVLDLKIHK